MYEFLVELEFNLTIKLKCQRPEMKKVKVKYVRSLYVFFHLIFKKLGLCRF